MAITFEKQNNVVFVSHDVVLTMIGGKFVTLSLRRPCWGLICMWCCTKADESHCEIVKRHVDVTTYW